MADYTRREVVTHRTEFVLTSPTSAAEVGKAVDVAAAEVVTRLRGYDDAIHIEARDGEIVVWVEAEDAFG